MYKRTVDDVLTHGGASLQNLNRINRANLFAGVALDAQVGDDFVLFVWLEQNRFGWAFLSTFGTADAQIVDLVFNQALTFARRTFAIDVCNIFFPEIFQSR